LLLTKEKRSPEIKKKLPAKKRKKRSRVVKGPLFAWKKEFCKRKKELREGGLQKDWSAQQ